jgi:serine/threonine protein kinase
MDDFYIEREIACGSFSKVYEGRSWVNGEKMALKVAKPEIITHEKEILESLPDCEYFPKVLGFGKIGNETVLGMSLLGPVILNHILQNQVSTYDILPLIDQILSAIRILHKSGYIHKDIKPHNICMDLNNKNQIVLIDFGIAEKYFDSNSNHKLRKLLVFQGNIAFCSENVACGISPSRRDDIESLCYLAIYLIKKKLPWIAETNINKNIEIRLSSKQRFFKTIPIEFKKLLEYTQSLKFEEEPDYPYISHLINLYRKNVRERIFYAEIVPRRVKKNRKANTHIEIMSEFPTLISRLPEFSEKFRRDCIASGIIKK